MPNQVQPQGELSGTAPIWKPEQPTVVAESSAHETVPWSPSAASCQPATVVPVHSPQSAQETVPWSPSAASYQPATVVPVHSPQIATGEKVANAEGSSNSSPTVLSSGQATRKKAYFHGSLHDTLYSRLKFMLDEDFFEDFVSQYEQGTLSYEVFFTTISKRKGLFFYKGKDYLLPHTYTMPMDYRLFMQVMEPKEEPGNYFYIAWFALYANRWLNLVVLTPPSMAVALALMLVLTPLLFLFMLFVNTGELLFAWYTWLVERQG